MSQLVTPSKPIEAPQQEARFWYCGVAFNRVSATYSYISDIGRLDTDDEVRVPFGSGDTLRIGTVKTCRFVKATEVPCPVEMTKHVIRIATEENYHSSTTVPLFNGNKSEYSSLFSTLQYVADKN